MPDYVFEIGVWQQVWPPLALAAVFALIAFVLAHLWAKDVKAELVGFVFTISVVGAIVGQLTGQSREAAVDSVVPAVLSILGAMFAYLWLNEKHPTKTIPIVGAAVALAVSLFVGVLWGAQNRVAWENYRESFAYLAGKEEARLRLDFVRLDHQRIMDELLKDLEKQDAEKAEQSGAEE